MATLEALAPRTAELRMSLSVNQTIVDREGVQHYRQLREVLRPLGVRHEAVLAYPESAMYHLKHQVDVAPRSGNEYATFTEMGPQEVATLAEVVERDLEQRPWVERWAKRYYWAGIRCRVLESGREPSPSCVALRSHLRLLPNGDVPTCQFNTHRVGNLKNASFTDVWDSPVARRQRAWVDRCPGCWAECEVLPNAFYTGDLLRRSWMEGRLSLGPQARGRHLPGSLPETAKGT
jgi:MoaA/NifB/PqqE/SkfB family radical SAM enzyme